MLFEGTRIHVENAFFLIRASHASRYVCETKTGDAPWTHPRA